MLLVLTAAWAACPAPADTKVRWSDPIHAAAYRHLLFRELRALRDGDGCAVYSADGLLDFVDVAALGERDRAYRQLAEDLRGALAATPQEEDRLRKQILNGTSGYSKPVRDYLLRFVAATETIQVREEREGPTHLVYLQRWQGKEIVPATSAFTFRDDDPDLARRIHRAIIDLYPELDQPPIAVLSASQPAENAATTVVGDTAAPFSIRPGLPVQFDAGASSDSQTLSADLEFFWTVDGKVRPEHGPSLTETFAADAGALARAVMVGVTVSDGRHARAAEMKVVVEPTDPPGNKSAAVQVIGWAPGGPVYLNTLGASVRTLHLEVYAASEPTAWRWTQVGGPPLDCLAATYDVACTDVGTLVATGRTPDLEVWTAAPGRYAFDVVAIRSGIVSAPARVDVLAVQRRASASSPLVTDTAVTIHQAFSDAEPEEAAELRIGLSGLQVAGGYGTGFERWRGEEAPNRLLLGVTMGLFEATDDLLTLLGDDRIPAAGAVRWTPSVDIDFALFADLRLSAPEAYTHPSGIRERLGVRASAYGVSLAGGLSVGPDVSKDAIAVENLGYYVTLGISPGRLGGTPLWPNRENLQRVRAVRPTD